jgi:hypothetical protein
MAIEKDLLEEIVSCSRRQVSRWPEGQVTVDHAIVALVDDRDEQARLHREQSKEAHHLREVLANTQEERDGLTRRCEDLEKALRTDTETDIRELRRQLGIQQEALRKKNLQLDAMHFVWCDGGCRSGVHRWPCNEERVTEEVVAQAERNTLRLRSWFTNRQWRDERGY